MNTTNTILGLIILGLIVVVGSVLTARPDPIEEEKNNAHLKKSSEKFKADLKQFSES